MDRGVSFSYIPLSLEIMVGRSGCQYPRLFIVFLQLRPFISDRAFESCWFQSLLTRSPNTDQLPDLALAKKISVSRLASRLSRLWLFLFSHR
jgi:hypothetical protein